MTSYSFGNRWVGRKGLHEPPVQPTLKEISQRAAAEAERARSEASAQRRDENRIATNSTSGEGKRFRADRTYLDLDGGVTCTVVEAQSMLRQMIKTMKRSGRPEQATTCRAAQRQLGRGDLNIDTAIRTALRRGVLAARAQAYREGRIREAEGRQRRTRRRR